MTGTLRATDITKRFGGVTALDEVSIEIHPGEIHGLIGPNGSGKTTLLNMLSGYYQPDAGEIAIGETLLLKTPVRSRSKLGLARTFQTPKLLGTLTVIDNAMVGRWSTVRSGFIGTALGFPRARREEDAGRERAAELLAAVGLGYAADRRANLLEHAEQRFLEIVRCLMMNPRFLMLDEPAGGLTIGEIDHLADVIEIVKASGIGVLLVEHHTDFVFRLCDRVTALDLGKRIAHGSARNVRADPDVIRVYLGQ